MYKRQAVPSNLPAINNPGLPGTPSASGLVYTTSLPYSQMVFDPDCSPNSAPDTPPSPLDPSPDDETPPPKNDTYVDIPATPPSDDVKKICDTVVSLYVSRAHAVTLVLGHISYIAKRIWIESPESGPRINPSPIIWIAEHLIFYHQTAVIFLCATNQQSERPSKLIPLRSNPSIRSFHRGRHALIPGYRSGSVNPYSFGYRCTHCTFAKTCVCL